jgi:cardiolipin synthase
MTLVRVAIPLAKGKRRFHLDKGRPWSVVEHALLAAVAAEPHSVADLASKSNLPRRLVLEILIRLMRAGWVVLDQRIESTLFSASASGLAVVGLDELPNAPKRIKRWMNFVIDKVTGTLYRGREFPFYERRVLVQRAERERLVWMDPREFSTYDEPAALVATILDEDERFIAIDPSSDRLVDRYGLVTVRHDTIEGLPTRAPRELTELVLQAAKDAPAAPAGIASPLYRPAAPSPFADRDAPEPIRAAFELDDLILGGEEHKKCLHEALRKARHRIVIHSTFIAEERFHSVRPLLHDAAKRGVLVDILWGEDEEKSGSRATNATVRRIRQEVSALGLSATLRVHPFSTRSHAKILVTDEGTGTKLYAVVGSCNWLSSGFESFEASIRLRDPRLTASVLDQLAELSRGSDGHWTDLTNDLARMAADARRQKTPNSTRGELNVVIGPQHAQYVRTARDGARSRLFVTSHRLGAATRPMVIVPALAAVRARSIEATIYFGVATGSVSVGEAKRLTESAAEGGVDIRPISEPRLHAKILAWDDDYLVLTSQNWLSADPSEANFRREIGVFVHAKGAARHIVERFELMRQN